MFRGRGQTFGPEASLALRPSYTTIYEIRYFMVALWNRETIYIFMLWFVLSSSSFFSSPNLSGRRLDVYHTLAHGVALVRI